MKKIRLILALLTLTSFAILLTAACPAPKAATSALAPSQAISTAKPLPLKPHGLEEMAARIKGAKLTLKEKIALKIFGKKIASKPLPYGDGKSQVIALILCIAVGALGIHRFYLGYTWQGIVQLLTLGACGIWSLIDLIRIITGDLQPKDGEYGKTL